MCQAVHLLPTNGAQLFVPGGALAEQTVSVLVSRILSSSARQMARQDIVLVNFSLPRVLILSLSPAPHLILQQSLPGASLSYSILCRDGVLYPGVVRPAVTHKLVCLDTPSFPYLLPLIIGAIVHSYLMRDVVWL